VTPWLLPALLGAISLWLSGMNWYALIRQTFSRRSPSWIPLVGGLLGIAAIWVAPGNRLDRFLWIPLFVDAGCLPGFASTLFWHIYHRRRDH
jgi:hypothetical protein